MSYNHQYNNMTKYIKSRTWGAVVYPESAPDNWIEILEETRIQFAVSPLHDKDVNVAYAGKSYVSVRGRAEVVEDIEKKKELWSKAYEKMLKTSYDDPNIVLIKVKAEAAEYWETGNFAKQIAFLYKRMRGQQTESTDINETIELDK